MPIHIDQHLNLTALQELKDYILEKQNSIIPTADMSSTGELTIRVRRSEVLTLLHFLHDDKQCQFRTLIDICGVDWLGKESTREGKRFDVVYHLLSLSHNQRLRVKVFVAEGDSVPSAVEVFDGANWYERETFDMFGIPFENHPDLRRILTDYDFDGFPLRKDFPLEGKVETYFDKKEKRVAYKPVDLPQELRHFDGQSPWQAMTGNAHLAEKDAVFDNSEFTAEEGAK